MERSNYRDYWVVYGHSPDANQVEANPEANSAKGWTWRVRIDPPKGRSSYWNSETQEFDKDNKNGRARNSNDTHNPMEDPTVEENDDKKDSDQTIDDGGDVYEFRNGEWVKIGHYNPFLGVTPVNPSTGTMPDIPMDIPMDFLSLIPIG